MDIQFLEEAISNFRQTGSIAPSSQFLVDKMLQHLDLEQAQVIELGAGDGVFTRSVLEEMGSKGHLTSFEINENFIQYLEKIQDQRFVLRNESVEILKDYEPESVDVVLSCLPIANFSHDFRHEVLSASARILKPGGLFMQYQYFPWNYTSVRQHFPNTSFHFVLRNFPPAFYYVARK